MLTKAVLEILQGLTYLSHNLLIILPIKCSHLKFSFVSPRSGFKNVLTDIFWPLVILCSLTLTVYELSYFVFGNEQRNLRIILYHGIFLSIRLPVAIWYFAMKTTPNEFCQMFNAVVTLSKVKLGITSKAKARQTDDLAFVILLLSTVGFLLGFHLVAAPISSVLLSCYHGVPILTWVFGNCSSRLYGLFIYFLILLVGLPIGSIGSLVSISSYLTIRCVDTRIS